jgi:rubredoxin
MDFKTYMCVICGYVYDEEKGEPDEGIPAGTLWADIPDDWKCPDCEATKIDFELIEI